jgi:hypothetical protein
MGFRILDFGGGANAHILIHSTTASAAETVQDQLNQFSIHDKP